MRIVCTVVAVLLLSASAATGQQGRTVFEGKGNCSTCHGRAGVGTTLGPRLDDTEWLHGDGSADAIRIVQSGVTKPRKYPAPMPPLGGARLSRAEIDAVVSYVLSLQPPPGLRSPNESGVPGGRPQPSGEERARWGPLH
jgi:mono/diheme cytochrome c family protein